MGFFVLVPEIGSKCKSGPYHDTRRSAGLSGARETRLDMGGLDGLVQKYFMNGLAELTNHTYSCEQMAFCQAAGFPAIPASEVVLCRFVASLASEGLKHRSIKTYLGISTSRRAAVTCLPRCCTGCITC